MLAVTSPLFFWLLLALSVVVLLRGHNEIGGGFVGGLTAALAFAIVSLADGVERARAKLRLHPLTLAGGGLLLALASGLPGLVLHGDFLRHVWFEIGHGRHAPQAGHDAPVRPRRLPGGAGSRARLSVRAAAGGGAVSILYAFVAAGLFGCGLYMVLSRHLIRMLLGLSLLTTAVNLVLFQAGRIRSAQPPLIAEGADPAAAIRRTRCRRRWC